MINLEVFMQLRKKDALVGLLLGLLLLLAACGGGGGAEPAATAVPDAAPPQAEPATVSSGKPQLIEFYADW